MVVFAGAIVDMKAAPIHVRTAIRGGARRLAAGPQSVGRYGNLRGDVGRFDTDAVGFALSQTEVVAADLKLEGIT